LMPYRWYLLRDSFPTAATLCVSALATQDSYCSSRPSTRLSSGLQTPCAALRRRACSVRIPAWEFRLRSP
jgi:hypothetical protein